MSKFNRPDTRPAAHSPVTSTATTPDTRNHEGAVAYSRDARSELFLLAVSNLVGEKTFYETARDRDSRFSTLVRAAAVNDMAWLAGFLPWLRDTANMRTAPVVAACEAVHARLAAGAQGGNRQLIASVLKRADEPAEMLAYWTTTYGRAIPKPVKRGVADAVQRLYDERALLKWDTGEGFRFADVLELVHAAPRAPWQNALFRHAIDRRHNRDGEPPAELDMVNLRARLMRMDVPTRRSLLGEVDAERVLARAGMTWEVLSGWLQGPMDAQAWEKIIPSMGLFALVRNLRNFDQAGVSDKVAAQVAERMADADQVRRSRMFPFRFLAAHQTAPSLRWAWPLEQALTHSLSNVPSLPGRSLVLVDRSPSMWGQKMSERSDMSWADGAAVFGAALALRAERADLVEFGAANYPVRFDPSESVLKVVARFNRGDGTDIPRAVRDHLAPHHDRVIIVTDEQTQAGWLPSNVYGMRGHYLGAMPPTKIDDLVPAHVPLYMWNFAGYAAGAAPSGTGNRHTFGGLTDAAFQMIPLIERGRSADWPFKVAAPLVARPAAARTAKPSQVG